MILLLSMALAGGLHSGIPTTGVPGLGEARFLTPQTGWTAPVAGGVVKIYVGETEADAVDWYERSVGSLTLAPVTGAVLGDASFGDGDGLLGFRDGNVAVMVRVEHGARGLAETLHAAIVDGAPPPTGATLRPQADGTWRVEGATGTITFRGGQAVPFVEGQFRVKPEEVVLWDRYGRALVVR